MWVIQLDARSNQNMLSVYQQNPSGALGVMFQITSQGSFITAGAVRATNTQDGFLYIPTCAGTPTGTPNAKTGTVPIIYDTTNHRLWIYDNGAWS